MKKDNYIRFDWAIKRLLRQKANYVILEGFLSELLGEDIRIHSLLESESNQEEADDKYNRVDLLAEDSRKQLIIVEVQNTRELSYFQRMLYGSSKAIVEYIHLGDKYKEVRKVYSINIVYFDLGQGSDYIYHGYTHFIGVHTKDELLLSKRQQSTFSRLYAGDLFPEYYVIRVDEFNQKAVTPLDEWIQYLKTGEIAERPRAKGLREAADILLMDKMTPEDRARYIRHMDNLRIQWDVLTNAREEGLDEGRKEGLEEGRKKGLEEGLEEGRKKGLEEGRKEGLEKGRKEAVLQTALNLKRLGVSLEVIAQSTGFSVEEIQGLAD